MYNIKSLNPFIWFFVFQKTEATNKNFSLTLNNSFLLIVYLDPDDFYSKGLKRENGH